MYFNSISQIIISPFLHLVSMFFLRFSVSIYCLKISSSIPYPPHQIAHTCVNIWYLGEKSREGEPYNQDCKSRQVEAHRTQERGGFLRRALSASSWDWGTVLPLEAKRSIAVKRAWGGAGRQGGRHPQGCVLKAGWDKGFVDLCV